MEVSVPVDEAFIRHISESTGTLVNLFLGSELSVGTLASYNSLNIKEFSSGGNGDQDGIEKQSSLLRVLTEGEASYFEGISRIMDDGRQIGTVSILLSQEETRKYIREMLLWLTGIALGCLILMMPITWYFAASIATPINDAIIGLTESAEHIASAAGQASEASQSLAEKASEQAADLEETSSSLEEISSMTQQNAAYAEESASVSEQMNAQSEQMKFYIQKLAALVSRDKNGNDKPPAITEFCETDMVVI